MTLTLVICIILSPALFAHNHVHAIAYNESDPLRPGDSVSPCPVCGQAYAMVQILASTAPTCTTAGTLRYNCPECGGIRTVEYFALGHNWQYAGSQAATCTQAGWENYSCIRCSETTARTIPALGHDYKEEITKEATCTEDGIRTFTCTRCADTREETIEATGHLWIKFEKAATCTEDGYTREVCSYCEEKKDETVIPALGHDWPQAWTIRREATNTKEGLKTRTCRRCGTVDSQAIPRKISVWYYVGGGLVVAAAAVAAIIARARAKIKLKKPSFGTRTVVTCTKNEEFVKLLKKKSFLKVRPCGYEELDEKLKDEDPDILIIDGESPERVNEVAERREELLKDKGIGFIVPKGFAKEAMDKINEMESESDVINHSFEGDSLNSMLVDLLLPVMKPDLRSDASLENVGKIADALEIPGVSEIIDIYIAGRDIKNTLEEDEFGLSEKATVIGDIADIMGYDRVSDIAGLVGDIKSIKSAAKKDAGAYERKKGVKGAKDIVKVAKDLTDGDD